jgi:hypothetical protein
MHSKEFSILYIKNPNLPFRLCPTLLWSAPPVSFYSFIQGRASLVCQTNDRCALFLSTYFPTSALQFTKPMNYSENNNNTMTLTHTSSVAVYGSLRGRKNPRSRYSSTISGYPRVGDFVYLAPSTSIANDDSSSIHSKTMMQFRSSKTFGEVTNLYNGKS